MRISKVRGMRFLLFALALLTVTFAHPGGLDKNGGHHDRKAGTYHYHRAPATNSPSSQPQSTARPLAATAGRVVRVSDGDTVTILTAENKQVRVRLDGIDAPESKQAFGERAREALAAKIAGKAVVVNVTTTDRYGRTVGRIILDELDVNLAMVREGWAWWYRQYAPKDGALKLAEENARAKRLGLWADATPVAPWEFRKAR